MPQAGQEATSTDKPITECPKKRSEAGYRCVCLNARSLVNKKNKLNIMIEDIDPHIIGITESNKVRDKVGPLENNRGNIISGGFQMAEVLNEYFSSVFTTEDISSLPVPFTKFEGNTSEHLGQLFVTPEMIATKIKKMKDNKSPGVDGIPPTLL